MQQRKVERQRKAEELEEQRVLEQEIEEEFPGHMDKALALLQLQPNKAIKLCQPMVC